MTLVILVLEEMFSAKVILLFFTGNALFLLLCGSKQSGRLGYFVQDSFRVSVCTSLLKRSFMEPSFVLEDYEQFLGVMFRNFSDIGFPSVSFSILCNKKAIKVNVVQLVAKNSESNKRHFLRLISGKNSQKVKRNR